LDAFIALGIVGEVLFSRKDSRIQTELRNRSNKRVEEAIMRAATLEKDAAAARERVAEMERLFGWRHVPSEEGFSQLVRAVQPIAASLDVLIEYERGDAEATSFAMEIVVVFTSAGVTKIRHVPNQYFNNPFGLALTASSESDRQILQAAFAAAGLSPLKMQKDLSTHLPRNEPAPNVYVFVAPKPPPRFAVNEVVMTQSNAARE
jgi:hypothetical protein